MLQDWALTQRVARLPLPSRIASGWLERHRFALALAAGMALVFAYRMVVLRSQVALGVDAGNYLATMQQLFGTDVTGEGLTRPPLVGLALWPLVHIFGPTAATKLLAVGVSALMAVPFYLLCSRLTGKGVALAASLIFLSSPRYMDALNWGFLTLAAVGLFTLCFYLMYEVLMTPAFDVRRVLALGVASLALLGTNRTGTFICVFVALAFGAVALIVGGQLRRGVLRLLPAALVALLLALPIVGLYVGQWGVVGHDRYLSLIGSLDGLSSSWDGLRYFFPGAYQVLWATVVLLGLTGSIVLLRRSPTAGAFLSTLLVGLFALSMLLTGDAAGRAGYYLYVPIWLGVAVCADALVRTFRDKPGLAARGAVLGLAVVTSVAALTTWVGHLSLRDAATYYGYMGAEHVEAIETADRLSPAGVGVAYPWPLGQWTEGLAGRRVYSANQRSLLSHNGRQTRELMADALLSGERVTTNGSALVADAYSVEGVPMDPVLGVDNGAFKHLLYLDDQAIEIEYGGGLSSRRVTLADGELHQHVTSTESGAWVDRRTYDVDGLLIVKEVTVPEHGAQATVRLEVDSLAGPVTSLSVPLQSALPSAPVSLGPQQAMFGFNGWAPFTFRWWSGTYVDLASSRTDASTLALTPSEVGSDAIWRPAGGTIAVAEVKPQSPHVELALTFTFEGWPPGDQAGLRTFTAQDAIQQHGITFALVDRWPSLPWHGDPLATTTQAWLERGPYFEPLWDDGRVAAYGVEPLPQSDSGQAMSETR